MNKMVRNSVENRSREQFAAAEISTTKTACKNDWKSFWHCQFFAQRTNEVNLSSNFVEIESCIRNKGRVRRISFNWAYYMYFNALRRIKIIFISPVLDFSKRLLNNREPVKSKADLKKWFWVLVLLCKVYCRSLEFVFTMSSYFHC